MSWYYQKYPFSVLGTSPKITHWLFGSQVFTKQSVQLHRHRTGNSKVTFLLDLATCVSDSWTAEYSNCAAPGTEAGVLLRSALSARSSWEVQCDAEPRGEPAQPRSSGHGSKGARKAQNFGSTKQLLCLQGQPGSAGDMAVFIWGGFGWIWWAELRVAPQRAAGSVGTPRAQLDTDSALPSLPVLTAPGPQPCSFLLFPAMFSTGWVLLFGFFFNIF